MTISSNDSVADRVTAALLDEPYVGARVRHKYSDFLGIGTVTDCTPTGYVVMWPGHSTPRSYANWMDIVEIVRDR